MLAGTALLARRINVAPAILLLLAGIALAFVPGMPSLELPPELVLLVVLPPLIYSASVAMSWREFKSNLRPIILLSVGCVIFTAFAVAAATHYLIGLPWASASCSGPSSRRRTWWRRWRSPASSALPRRILVVLEGEGLANDATALILYRFAVAAISTGACSRCRRRPARSPPSSSARCCSARPSAGSACATRHRARDPQVEITLSLITPYIAYWIPEHFGGSGVIATVACGLYMSWNGPLLISSATRLQGIFFWDLVIYLIEGLLFLLTGFQMRLLFEKSKAFPLDDILLATALVAVIVIVARFAWVYPATYLPRLLRQAPARTRSAAVVADRVRDRLHRRARRGVAGRGAGAAVRAAERRGFPLSRPDPVRRLRRHLHHAGRAWVWACRRWCDGSASRKDGRDEHIAEHESEIAARREALDAALKSLDAITDDRELSDEVVKLLRARHEIRANQLPDALDPDAHDVSAAGTDLTRELIAAERKFIHVLLRDGKITDETRRRIERDLDLEEASLSNREYRKMPL